VKSRKTATHVSDVTMCSGASDDLQRIDRVREDDRIFCSSSSRRTDSGVVAMNHEPLESWEGGEEYVMYGEKRVRPA